MDLENVINKAKKGWADLYSGDIPIILIGAATCGKSAGSIKIKETFAEETKKRNIECKILEVGCIGLCYAEPLICIKKPGNPIVCYRNITPEKALELVNSYLEGNDPLPEYALGTIGDGSLENIPSFYKMPVLKHQVRLVLNNCGIISPTDIDHYFANNGYQGLIKALKQKPADIIEHVKQSGLRGRGGAGFPTWKKWQICRDTKSDEKFLICNADEGDPGAFMNRSLIESDPHSLIEGMIISAYAIGANTGYIYCRAEYPLALARLDLAIKQAEKLNLLGDNILGSGFDFRIKVKEGAGAFVCGEETALIASVEGERGMPRTRPPFPAVEGLLKKPTIINNVETLATVSRIFQNDAKWFARYGTEKSKGTKTFALAGEIKRTGLIEVPLGITLKTIIYDIGGGIPDNKEFKAVQTGGPSGGCVPKELLDIPVDYDSLVEAGTIMGSGGLVVMNENTCMVDVARYFIDFTQKESCGKCVPCRFGNKQLFEILDDITKGKAEKQDIELLEKLGKNIKATSLCGLGQTSPNPVLTTIRYFKNEYDAHIAKQCPAKVCKGLISYVIDPEKCTGCYICFKACPTDAIIGKPKEKHYIIQEKCIKCGICYERCPDKFMAIDVFPGRQ